MSFLRHYLYALLSILPFTDALAQPLADSSHRFGWSSQNSTWIFSSCILNKYNSQNLVREQIIKGFDGDTLYRNQFVYNAQGQTLEHRFDMFDQKTNQFAEYQKYTNTYTPENRPWTHRTYQLSNMVWELRFYDSTEYTFDGMGRLIRLTKYMSSQQYPALIASDKEEYLYTGNHLSPSEKVSYFSSDGVTWYPGTKTTHIQYRTASASVENAEVTDYREYTWDLASNGWALWRADSAVVEQGKITGWYIFKPGVNGLEYRNRVNYSFDAKGHILFTSIDTWRNGQWFEMEDGYGDTLTYGSQGEILEEITGTLNAQGIWSRNDRVVHYYAPLTGLERSSAPELARIFPNPSASGHFFIDAMVPLDRIEIYDGKGQIVARLNQPSLNEEIDPGNLPKGLYFLIVFKDNTQQALRWVVR